MEITFDSIFEASESLKKFLPKGFEPKIGIICGSGLSAIADAIEPIDEIRDELSYADINGFPVSGGKNIFIDTCGISRVV
jgi:purine nucleoside phosphorylase